MAASPDKNRPRGLLRIYQLVTQKISDILYKIEGRKGNSSQVLHHDRIKLCNDRDIPLWIRRKRAKWERTNTSTEELEDLMEPTLWADESGDPMDISHGDPPSPTPDLSIDETLDPQDTGDPLRDYQSPDFVLPGIRRSPTGGPRQLTRRVRPPTRLRDYVP